MKIILCIALCLVSLTVTAGEADSLVVAQGDKHIQTKPKSKSIYPTFGLWRNSYFATGISTNQAVSQYSADAKFQISFAVRLWNIKGKADIFLAYTQHSVWDIYQKSCPFRETAYNPGIWAAWQVDRKVRLLFGIEHESNGMADTNSRSFNYATAAAIYDAYPRWRFGGRVWYGYYDRDNIDDYFRYRGLFQLWATYHTLNDRFSVTALINPSNQFRNCNVQVEASWRLAKRGDWLPALYIQYMSGYGDTMLDYNRYASKIRIGISFTNNKLGLY